MYMRFDDESSPLVPKASQCFHHELYRAWERRIQPQLFCAPAMAFVDVALNTLIIRTALLSWMLDRVFTCTTVDAITRDR